ncbi:MAG: hypothetical protein LJE70_02110 [Chromatiaceae bacterium]|nr:hypothetical protein [Chromatiaceae bacterium]
MRGQLPRQGEADGAAGRRFPPLSGRRPPVPLLLPSSGNQLRADIDEWLHKHRVHPRMLAEYDDSALMKAFGREGVGIFIAPTAIEAEVALQ